MLKFIQTGKTGGDCTCPYSVISDTSLTVAELIQQILTRKEWGYINFYYKKIKWGTAISKVGYDNTQLSNTNENFMDIQKNLVVKITASGGWSRMDYDVLIKED